jgi:uncharacterized protein YybS (DUF2232 family)
MIEMSLHQSDPVALPHRPSGRMARSVAGFGLLMAVMIVVGMPVFVPAVIVYCGLRFGVKTAGAALFVGALLATLSFALGMKADEARFASSLVTGIVLMLGLPALAAVPLVDRDEPFGRVLALLVAGSVIGMALTELLWRAVASYSPYADLVKQAHAMVLSSVKVYADAGVPSDVLRVIERRGNYYSSTLVSGAMVLNAAVSFTLSLLMVGRLPAARQRAASSGPRASYQFRHLSLPDWVLFAFILGGLAPLAGGTLHAIAANTLLVAVFLYILQGFALLRFLLASLGVGFIGALVAFVLTLLTGVGAPLLGVVGLFDPFFDFRHFKKRKDDSHESHSD